MHIREFDFELPPELIAQEPPAQRGAARLLHLPRHGGLPGHTMVSALPELLAPGDLLVVNNTRVFPARLLGHRVPSGGAAECLLIGQLEPSSADVELWEALMHPGQKLKPGARVVFDGARRLHGEIIDRRFHGRRAIRLWTEDGGTVREAVDVIGHVPLPPYIKREDRAADRDRYQTVFARARGSVAAPTAGLHFDARLLDRLHARGIQTVEITLHVGYGTFQPVRVENIEEHHVETERYEVTAAAAATINAALDARRRVVAVGTTTTRALESVGAAGAGRIAAGSGTTDLFIRPPFEFRIISGLLTNFHLPKSSLLMLVAAFGGRERVLAAYAEAVRERYRFYSYGDAMLIA